MSADQMHLVQYTDPVTEQHRSTVLCREHRGPLLANLRRLNAGCSATTAGVLSKCDECR